MNVLIVGYGKMGQLIDALAGEQGIEVAGRVDDGRDEWRAADVAIDFTTADALVANFPALPPAEDAGGDRHDRLGGARRRRLREQAERAGLGVVASANFSIGVNIFQLVVDEAARLMQAQPQYGAWIHEAHHATKRDAPSGTALMLRDAMVGAGFDRAHRHVVDAGRHDSRHSHRRIRRGLGYDRAFAHRARSPWVCRRCAGGREVDSRPAGVVHHGRRPADAADQRSERHAGGSEDPPLRGRLVMRTPFTGVGTALITPFTKGGALDEGAVKRLAKRQIDAGVHFLVPCGTTGESPTLSHREKLRVVELVVEEAAGKVPVMAGAGGYDTREAIELSRDMEKVGADGLLHVTPYYNKPTQEGLYQHFKAIAESTRLPIMLYSVQGRTGVNIEAPTVIRLAQISEHRRHQGGVGQHRPDDGHRRHGARELPAPERRRPDHRAGDGDWRTRRDLGGVERGAGRTGADRRAVREERLRRGPQAPGLDAAAAHRQLLREQSRPVQGGDGGHGPLRRGGTGCRSCRSPPPRARRS